MEENKKMKKVLNPIDVLVTAFGAMIGWGWVISTGTWLTQAGVLGTVIGFVLGGIMIFLIGLTYSELTTAIPKSGGAMLFSLKALGPTGAYICSWLMILSYVGVVCFEACSIPTVLQYIFPSFLKGYLYTIAGFDIYATWVAVAVLTAILITYVNIRGIKVAALFQTILTIIIAAVGLILIVASIFNGSVMNVNEQIFSGSEVPSILRNVLSIAAVAPFFLFGFDVIPQVAEEINVPLKKIGKLMLLSIILAVAFYAFVVFAVGCILSKQEISYYINNNSLITADAMAKAFNSDAMAKVLIIGGICGIITSWNSFLMGGSRAIYAMEEAHMIPSVFMKIDSRYNTPSVAIFLIGFLSIASVFLGRSMLVWIANIASFACCVSYSIVAISFVVIRIKEPNLNRPYKVKNFKLVGIMSIIMSIVMSSLYLIPNTGCTFTIEEFVIAGIWGAIGCLLAFLGKKYYGKKFGQIENL